LRFGYLIVFLLTEFSLGTESLENRIDHTDPAKYQMRNAVHGGAGSINYMGLLDAHSLETDLNFLHRDVLMPHSGGGNYFHHQEEGMYLILDGEAEFTVDRHTSLLRGGAPALAQMALSRNLQSN
jgi:hypothetical protein